MRPKKDIVASQDISVHLPLAGGDWDGNDLRIYKVTVKNACGSLIVIFG